MFLIRQFKACLLGGVSCDALVSVSVCVSVFVYKQNTPKPILSIISILVGLFHMTLLGSSL